MVALGGALGAVSRYGVDRALIGIVGGPTVLGTFVVNITGSFLLGLFIAFTAERTGWMLESRLFLFLAVGILGSYTTFSTLTVASLQLFQGGEVTRGLLNIFGSIVVGLLAAFLGLVVGRAI
ncbi:MAG: CrcB family protein [Chloroflexi bacterium]|nr:CrcB family protein [Chloroflexota bacterium]